MKTETSFSRALFVSQSVLTGTLFFLIIFGASVRLMGAGLACPDWPLCHGHLIPTFSVPVFFEWFHRKIAMWIGVGALIIAVWIIKKPDLRKKLGRYVIISLLLFLVQALLGRETVTLFLKSQVVTAHLIGGYSLFAVNLLIFWKIWRVRSQTSRPNMPTYIKIFFLCLLVVDCAQIIMGGLVSSNYAGLACGGFPLCNGSWWPGFHGLMGIHFAHRLGAFTLLALILGFGVTVLDHLKDKALTRTIFKLLIFLVFLQFVWGVAMVYNKVPLGLSLAHSATSLLIFTLIVVGNYNVFSR